MATSDPSFDQYVERLNNMGRHTEPCKVCGKRCISRDFCVDHYQLWKRDFLGQPSAEVVVLLIASDIRPIWEALAEPKLPFEEWHEGQRLQTAGTTGNTTP